MKNEKTIYYFSGMSYQDMKRRLNVDQLFLNGTSGKESDL